jgi:hypothetical protein
LRTAFLLNKDEGKAFMSGEPFDIQVGNGQIITIQYEAARRRTVAPVEGESSAGDTSLTPLTQKGTPRKRRGKRIFTPEFRRTVILDAMKAKHEKPPRTVASVARKHDVSDSLLRTWMQRREK